MKITKKIRYIIDNKLPEYFFKRYPNLIKFIYGFVDFVDKECAEDILNMTEIIDIDNMKDTFIESMFETYCKNAVSAENFALTNSIKKELIMLGKMWFKNKGKSFSLDIALKYLSNYFITDENLYIENIEYEIEEPLDYWFAEDNKAFKKPYTYIIKGDFPISSMNTMIEKFNPVGFAPEYQFTLIPTEEWDLRLTNDRINYIINFDLGNPTELLETKIDEEFGISTNRGLDSDIVEVFDINSKLFQYNGENKYDGTLLYDAVDKGIHNDFSIKVYKNGELIDEHNFNVGE